MPSRNTILRSLAKSVMTLPFNTVLTPVFAMPRSTATVDPANEVTRRLPAPLPVSVSTRPVPAAFSDALTAPAVPSAMALNSSSRDHVSATSMPKLLPPAVVMVKSDVPKAFTPPVLEKKTAIGVERSWSVRTTRLSSVMPTPPRWLKFISSVSRFRPLKAAASILLLPLPPVSSASSRPSTLSTSVPIVRRVLVSVMLASRCSTSLSVPLPPRRRSAPRPPLSRSSPMPPISTSFPAEPSSTSWPAPPLSRTLPPVNSEASIRLLPP